MEELYFDGLYAKYYPGDRGTIIMMHGLLSSHGEFYNYPDKFNDKGYSVLAIDFEGHGRSSGKRGYESIENNIKNIRKWINYLEKENKFQRPLILMGHSLGAATTIYALARGLGDIGIAIAPPSSIKEELKPGERIGMPLIYFLGTLWEKITRKDFYIKYRVDYRALFEDEELIEIAKKLNYLENRLWIGSYKPLMSIDTVSEAKKVKKPCMIVVPSKDKVVNPENEKRVYEALGGEKELYIAKGYGHSIMIADKGEIFKKILEFIEKQRNK